MKVEIWSDVVCPWCYIGKRRLEAALARFPHADEVEVVWRSFELDPTAPATVDVDLTGMLASKYGVSRQQAEAMNARVTALAAEDGLAYRLDIAKPGRTFDAHRLVHLGAHHGRQGEVEERLLAAYQSEGRAIADHAVLVDVGVAAGLDEDEVRAVLAGDRYADEVRADEQEARELGVTGVPFFVIDRRYAVSGAQPADLLLQALQQAWAERSPLRVLAPAAGPDAEACGPDGCTPPS